MPMNENREAILKAAEELFFTHAFKRVTFRLIAQKAGVSPALVVYYFKNKEQLFDQLIEEHTPRLAKEFSSFKSRSQVQLSEIIVKYVQFWQNHPNIPILLTRGGLSQDFESRKKLEESRFNHVTKQTLYSALKKVPGCNDMNIDYYYMLVSSLSTQPYLNIDNNEACSKFNITDYTRVLEDLKFSAPSMC
ncbi:TetR/AcrR family transcriptional regulator [Vibrio penaeicida]|uniref:HTH tetR-type domain-containing protein n=3 Tax=Vibrio penaeicida TaxID=104609 RepID=A0AAV5NVW2_9VIBR|nr:TetR/AcrR family transcriptional regulator [Vibrio penaeicida]GLQ74116.1 hypothetical protein GCM10007932_34770 [Vibrio penaeicida]